MHLKNRVSLLGTQNAYDKIRSLLSISSILLSRLNNRLRKQKWETTVRSCTKRRLSRAYCVSLNATNLSFSLQLTYSKAQARAIYGPKYPYGSTFDVIYSCNDQNDYCVSWLIVYPQPDVAVVKTEKAVSNDWIPVLKSERMVKNPSVPDLFSTTYLLRDSYRNLIEKLRVQMVETMATMGK